MHQQKKSGKYIAMAVLCVVVILTTCMQKTYAQGQQIQEPQSEGQDAANGEITIEKSARWIIPEEYQAQLVLKTSGIRQYTQNQEPISVIPVLDVTNSMLCCESEGHVHSLAWHSFSRMDQGRELWSQYVKGRLPAKEEYLSRQGGELFLHLPEELDPTGKCRMVFTGNIEAKDEYQSSTAWKIVYVTDDQELLPAATADIVSYLYHSVEQDGMYLPIGGLVETEGRPVWKYQDTKSEAYGCVENRMDQLIRGYSGFLDTLFENEDVQVCPVAFTSGYYIHGWTKDKEEALAFLTEEGYRTAKGVFPKNVVGTNHEAAVMGAIDAIGQIGKTDNAFALIFTDGNSTSAYKHTDNKPDMSDVDIHSMDMPDHDKSWYPQYSQWAIEDAETLKQSVPVYGVGYGYKMVYDSISQQTVEGLSSGGEYYIDTRQQDLQDIMSIFRTIYQDMMEKAAKVHLVDYISEYWQPDVSHLPPQCKIESVETVNQKGEKETLTKLIYPVTKLRGETNEAVLEVPLLLKEPYRQVEELTWYETNQDEPLQKDREGFGGYVQYEDEEGRIHEKSAESPLLDVYPGLAAVFTKQVMESPIKAGSTAKYEFVLENQSQGPLQSIQIDDTFDLEETTISFVPQDGIEISEEGKKAVIPKLERGESITFHGEAQLPENAPEQVGNTATALLTHPKDPKKTLSLEAKAQVEVIPLVMDFQVEKTADKETAAAGDTITYEITISNTGEKELQSVLTTDKFVNAGLTAQFQKQDGIEISADGTSAMIASILPGEIKVLTAVTTLPDNFQEEEIINTAIVVVGDMKKEGQSVLQPSVRSEPQKTTQIQNEQPTVKASDQNAKASALKGSNGSSAKAPDTGDESPVLTLVFMVALSMFLFLVGIWLYMKRRE